MKKLLPLFIGVTAVNVGIFFFRDHFQYIKHSTYRELYTVCDEACGDKWDAFLEPYSIQAVQEGRRLLQPLQLDTGSTLSKIKAIGHHLYEKFHRQNGFPKDIIHRSPPLDQYKILSADTTQKLWCGTYAQMFSFFCWSHNIITRNVEIFKPEDHHVLNECFVPELNQWVMVDLTNNILLSENRGRLLNTQDFIQDLQKKASSTIMLAGGEFETEKLSDASLRHYYQPQYPTYYYHATDAGVVYNTSSKLKRYIFPVYWYEIFSPEKKTNILFYIKLLCLTAWLILSGVILIKTFRK